MVANSFGHFNLIELPQSLRVLLFKFVVVAFVEDISLLVDDCNIFGRKPLNAVTYQIDNALDLRLAQLCFRLEH